MNAKFTPGPWQVRCNDMVYDSGFRLVADCENLDKSKRPAPPTEEDMANARLIAAAPEMFAALEDAEFLLRKAGQIAGPMQDSFNRSAQDARAAIAKARGAA